MARVKLVAAAAVLLGLCLAAAGASAAVKERSGDEILRSILDSKQPFKAAGFMTLKPKEIKALTEALIHKMDAGLNLTAASVKRPSWAATMQPQVDFAALYDVASSPITFPSSMAPDEATRNASLAASDRISQWAVDANMRIDVYDALKAFNATPEARALTGEKKRYLEHSMRDARRSGLDLPKPKRDELAGLLKKMAKIGLDFSACLDADTTSLSFAPADLNGTSSEFVAGLKRDKSDAGKVMVTVKYPDYTPISQDCTVEGTRKALEYAFNNVCAKENTKRLDDLVALRAQVAALLGYPTWAAYVQETLMAKSPARVMGFLTELRGRLAELRDRQLAVLLDFKKQDMAAQGKAFDGKLHSWEGSYYANQVEKRDFSVDKQELKKYFPIEFVMPRLLELYQGLLGLQFQKDAPLSKAAWAPGVDAYKAYDSKSGELIGVFYLDLHPRDGKYGHAAMFGLQAPSQMRRGNGTERLAGVGALMCNFPKSTPAQPALLPHDDVTTLFHEMGHLFHQLLGRTQIISFAGTSVDTDFVEAPSQMLENWTWEPEVLRRITRHYKTGGPMPDALIDKLVKSRTANGGIFNSKQLAYGLFDQQVHTATTNVSTLDAYAQVMRDVTTIPPQKGTHPAARFGHLIGYDAKYYSYLWSQVFSADMFRARFKKEGIFNPKPGMDYRREILEPGGSRDADALLLAFIGRAPTQDAFLESLGLTAGPAKAAAPGKAAAPRAVKAAR
ncbi:MAG: Thimet oligopeptidase [Monoraphidium minutum]|nr:MAG: Thimet oligopeptidase [Monoraphidium minutum]